MMQYPIYKKLSEIPRLANRERAPGDIVGIILAGVRLLSQEKAGFLASALVLLNAGCLSREPWRLRPESKRSSSNRTPTAEAPPREYPIEPMFVGVKGALRRRAIVEKGSINALVGTSRV